MMDLKYLVIEGNTGAGKTTLAQMISKDYKAHLILEQFADNPFLPKPDLLVYLHQTPENLIQKIKKRGRTCEKYFSIQYLKEIETGCFKFFKQIYNFPVLLIDMNNIDFVTDRNHYRKITNLIFREKHIPGMKKILQ